jgi:hypothetical protein
MILGTSCGVGAVDRKNNNRSTILPKINEEQIKKLWQNEGGTQNQPFTYFLSVSY